MTIPEKNIYMPLQIGTLSYLFPKSQQFLGEMNKWTGGWVEGQVMDGGMDGLKALITGFLDSEFSNKASSLQPEYESPAIFGMTAKPPRCFFFDTSFTYPFFESGPFFLVS